MVSDAELRELTDSAAACDDCFPEVLDEIADLVVIGAEGGAPLRELEVRHQPDCPNALKMAELFGPRALVVRDRYAVLHVLRVDG